VLAAVAVARVDRVAEAGAVEHLLRTAVAIAGAGVEVMTEAEVEGEVEGEEEGDVEDAAEVLRLVPPKIESTGTAPNSDPFDHLHVS
jgi:hypothetical protein